MRIRDVELRLVALPLVRPFRTSFGEETQKEALLVRVETDEGFGWGECVASRDPRYSEEFTDGVGQVLREHLVPSLCRSDELMAEDLPRLLEWVRGHRMAKATLEMAG